MNIRERDNLIIDIQHAVFFFFFAWYILPGIIVDDSLANILFAKIF